MKSSKFKSGLISLTTTLLLYPAYRVFTSLKAFNQWRGHWKSEADEKEFLKLIEVLKSVTESEVNEYKLHSIGSSLLLPTRELIIICKENGPNSSKKCAIINKQELFTRSDVFAQNVAQRHIDAAKLKLDKKTKSGFGSFNSVHADLLTITTVQMRPENRISYWVNQFDFLGANFKERIKVSSIDNPEIIMHWLDSAEVMNFIFQSNLNHSGHVMKPLLWQGIKLVQETKDEIRAQLERAYFKKELEEPIKITQEVNQKTSFQEPDLVKEVNSTDLGRGESGEVQKPSSKNKMKI